MFGQFSATSPGQNPSFAGTSPTSGGDGPSSATPGAASSNSAPPVGVPGSRPPASGRTQKRGKRSQVPRACDTCRLYRSKCDNNPQCAPCVARGVKCTNTGQKPAYTLATATQYIEELVERIRELEEELAYYRRQNLERAHSPRRVPSPRPDLLSIGTGESIHYSENTHSDDETTIQEGHDTLGKELERMTSPLPFQPHTKIKSDPSATLSTAAPVTTNVPTEFESISNPYNGSFLGKNREDHYFNVYWNSYHAMIPIVNQKEVEKHFDGLWDEVDYERYPQVLRKPSPLLDIIMALCLQYGTNGALRNSNQPEYRSQDAALEGKDYYERCYFHIRKELESPTITTLQCYLFCTIYLLCSGKVLTAYHLLGLTIRMAYTLRVHQEMDDSDLQLGKRQLRRRIWWSMYRLDIRLSIELSLPHAIQVDQISCHYPSAPPESSGSSTINNTELHALRFHVLFTQLHTAARKIHGYMHRTKSQTRSLQHAQLPAIEIIALELNNRLSLLTNIWALSVPNVLKFPRLNGGTAFSVDCSRISYDYQSPLWLNRQRFFLESNYHMILLLLHRPFLRHLCPDPEQQNQTLAPTDNTPIANKLAFAALQHARSLIYLHHQLLTETDHFTGWYDAFNSTSAAAVCIQIYLHHYQQQPHLQQPGGLSFQALRDALVTSLGVFKDFAPSHPPSRDAEVSIRDFLNRLTGAGHRTGGVPLASTVHASPSARVASPHNASVGLDESKGNIIRVISPSLGHGVPPSDYPAAPMQTPPPRTEVMVQVPPEQQMPINWPPPHSTVMHPAPQSEPQWEPQYSMDQIYPSPGTIPVGLANDPVWTGQGGFVPPQPRYGPQSGNGGSLDHHGKWMGALPQQGHQVHHQHQLPSEISSQHLRHQHQEHHQRRSSQHQQALPQHEQHTQHSQQHPHPGTNDIHMRYYGDGNRE